MSSCLSSLRQVAVTLLLLLVVVAAWLVWRSGALSSPGGPDAQLWPAVVRGGVEGVAWSPDGRLLAALDAGGHIVVHSASDGQLVRTFDPDRAERDVALAGLRSDGSVIVCGESGRARVRAAETVTSVTSAETTSATVGGAPLRATIPAFRFPSLRTPPQVFATARCALSADGRFAAAAMSDGSVCVTDLAADGGVSYTLASPPLATPPVKSSPPAGRRNSEPPPPDARALLALAFTSDGSELRAVTPNDGDVWSWDATALASHPKPHLQMQAAPAYFGPQQPEVIGATFFGDARRVVLGWSTENGIQVWDTADSSATQIVHLKFWGQPLSMAVSRDGRRIAVGSYVDQIWGYPRQTCLQVYSAETKSWMSEPEGHVGIGLSLAFSPDDGQLLVGGPDGALRVRDPRSGGARLKMDPPVAALEAVAVSPGWDFAVTANEKDVVRVFDMDFLLATNPYHTGLGWINFVALSRDRQHAFVALSDETPAIVDLAKATDVLGLPRGAQASTSATLADPAISSWASGVRSASFSSDDALVAASRKNGSLCVWDAQSSTITLETPLSPANTRTAVTCSPTVPQMLVREERYLPAPALLTWVAIQRSRLPLWLGGKYLTRGGTTAVLRMLSLPDGKVIWERILGGEGFVCADPVFAPDGQSAIVACDSCVERLDAATGESRALFGGPTVPPYWNIALSCDGTRLLGFYYDMIEVRRMPRGELLATLRGFAAGDEPLALSMSPANDRVLLVGKSGRVYVWDVKP